MAAKIILLVILAVAYAQEKCRCDERQILKEVDDTFKFLKTVSTNSDTLNYPIVPGLLSPLVSCDCEGNNRKKRKIFPDTHEKEIVHPTTKRYEEHAGIRNKCPVGFRRVGFMCLNADLL